MNEITPNIAPRANDLVSMAQRAIIKDDQTYKNGGDLIKMIDACIKESEIERQGLVKPLNDHVKMINRRFKDYTDPLNQSRNNVKKLMLVWANEQERQRQAEIEKKRKEQEEKALELAAQNPETADEILETAINLPQQDGRIAKQYGDYGSTSSVVKNWYFRITDFRQIPGKYLIVNQDDEKLRPYSIDAIKIDGTLLKADLETGIKIPGIEFFQKSDVRIR